MKPGRSLRRVPLFWKVLLPFLGLIVLLGVAGTFLIVRDLASNAQARLDQDLARRSLDARAVVHDRELYLLEGANFAANIQGMAAALERPDQRAVAQLLASVLALKPDVGLLAVVDPSGRGVAEFRRSEGAARPTRTSGSRWNDHFVRSALTDLSRAKHSGLLSDGGATLLAIAAPICADPSPCRPVGVAVVGIGIDLIAREAAGLDDGLRSPAAGPSVQIFDADGVRRAAVGMAARGAAANVPAETAGELIRLNEQLPGGAVATVYAPLSVQGRRIGTVAVSIPRDPVFASVRGAAVRLGLIVLAAMAGVVAVGALLSRFILGQVKHLVETNRALGRGELTARVAVVSEDELGELARGVNQMAEQLQASYETLELRVAQRTEEVRRLLAERTEFFAAMSHDFRTPLAVILNEAELLSDPTFPRRPADVAESGRTIKSSGKQVLSMINDVLELARAEAGRLEISFEDLHLSDVMADLSGTLEALARSGELELAINLPKTLPPVTADRRRLREVLLNLVDNAVKYTPPGGRVSVTAAAHNGSVEVAVSDTGVGIPPEAGTLVFEPFYRVKGTRPARGQPSTGLGLALTRRLVEAHGGTISFASDPGGGTTFRFDLAAARSRGRGSKAAGGAGRRAASSSGETK